MNTLTILCAAIALAAVPIHPTTNISQTANPPTSCGRSNTFSGSGCSCNNHACTADVNIADGTGSGACVDCVFMVTWSISCDGSDPSCATASGYSNVNVACKEGVDNRYPFVVYCPGGISDPPPSFGTWMLKCKRCL